MHVEFVHFLSTGYGDTKDRISINDKKDFLYKFIKLAMPESTRRVTIVSPSMSGSYSLELLKDKPGNFKLVLSIVNEQRIAQAPEIL